jgi:hypothetical protein
MSNAKPKPVAEINLEEFERRLRASAAPQAGVEDPLAELTRLVDSIGFERTPSERALDLSRAARPAPPPPPRAESRPELRLAPPPEAPKPAPAPLPVIEPPPRVLKAPEPPPPVVTAPEPAPEPTPVWEEAEPAAEAEPALRPSFQAEDLDSYAFDPPTPSSAEAGEASPPSAPRAEGPTRVRHWGLKVGGLVAAGVVMIGAVVVFKLGNASHSGAPPLILASTAPTKVAPPNEETIRTANESGSLLTRDTAQPTATPPKLVEPPEAPVDLSARAQPAESPAPAPAATDASPVAPSSETPIVAAATPKATPISPVSADPSRVKTISVRPDGTLISSGYESAQVPLGTTPQAPATPASPEPQALAAADGEASSPAVALPTKLAPPKSSARVVNKTDTTAPADAASPGPVPVKPKKPKPTPTPVAEAEPTKTDDAAEAAPAPSGGYAVQLAAPKSESDAKALVRALPGRYSSALSGASLGIRKADRNGETIYRVRAMGLTKAEASAMCSKVKAAGGDCYVAKN